MYTVFRISLRLRIIGFDLCWIFNLVVEILTHFVSCSVFNYGIWLLILVLRCFNNKVLETHEGRVRHQPPPRTRINPSDHVKNREITVVIKVIVGRKTKMNRRDQ